MRVLLIGGNHPRHLYYMDRIASSPNVEIVGAIIEQRGTMQPEPPPGTPAHDAQLWHRHFKARDERERAYFDNRSLLHFRGKSATYNVRVVSGAGLNSFESATFAQAFDADICLVFGCGMIRKPLAGVLPDATINLHLGLSPRYRGAATLFWPFYMLEPNWAGATFHVITAEPDAGEVLHQSRPQLIRGDTIHDVACRTVVQASADMLKLLARWPDWTVKRQKNTGKCFLARDFQPAHLRGIYDVWNDKLVDAYLDGTIEPAEPVLYQVNMREVEYA